MVMVTLGFEENITQIVIFVGAFLGNFIATAPPYWRTQEFFKEFDLKIIFDPKFLGTALVTGISSIIIVSAGFSQIVQGVNSEATLIMAFVTAASLGWALNTGVNKLMPSVNTEENKLAQEKIESRIIEEHEKNKTLQELQKSSSTTVAGEGRHEA
jgi:hypothetical protein